MIPFYPFFRKELRLLNSFCYNKEDFQEVHENDGRREILDPQTLPKVFQIHELEGRYLAWLRANDYQSSIPGLCGS